MTTSDSHYLHTLELLRKFYVEIFPFKGTLSVFQLAAAVVYLFFTFLLVVVYVCSEDIKWNFLIKGFVHRLNILSWKLTMLQI